jgi:hypothetical protein
VVDIHEIQIKDWYSSQKEIGSFGIKLSSALRGVGDSNPKVDTWVISRN